MNSICPEFELTNWWSQQNGRTFAACFQRGHVIRFWSPLIDLLPEELVEIVVAHELAHTYLAVVGNTYEMTPDDWKAYSQGGVAYAWDDEELDVQEVMECWGFDEDALDRWIADNRSECDRIQQRWESGL